jgi:hypothetical protein
MGVNNLGLAAHQELLALGIVRKLTIASYWCTLLSYAADGHIVEYVNC